MGGGGGGGEHVHQNNHTMETIYKSLYIRTGISSLWMTWDQFHRAVKHRTFMLRKIGYRPNCHVMFIASGWFSVKFCSENFAKQDVLLSNSMRLGPVEH